MPHKHTFTIPVVQCLLRRFVKSGKGWADPFANNHSPAEHTNDLNIETQATHHMDAVEFLATFKDASLDGVLLDPPYSMHQITECYDGHGGKRIKAMRAVYEETARIVKHGGMVLCFGWNSNGVGNCRGFGMIECVLIPHGGSHNDTIVTVETKLEATPELWAEQPNEKS